MTRPSLLRATMRALALRCPRCGGGDLFENWLKLRPACPSCGQALQRGEHDHWLGAFAVNLVAAELIGVGVVIAFVLISLPDVPWRAVQIAAPLIMVALPFLFFPFSRTLWLAWDLHFRPEQS
jgi:uncharacterized protein (DUF983 family)